MFTSLRTHSSSALGHSGPCTSQTLALTVSSAGPPQPFGQVRHSACQRFPAEPQPCSHSFSAISVGITVPIVCLHCVQVLSGRDKISLVHRSPVNTAWHKDSEIWVPKSLTGWTDGWVCGCLHKQKANRGYLMPHSRSLQTSRGDRTYPGKRR